MIRCQFNKHNEGSVKPPAVNFILNIFNRFKRNIRILKTTTESNFFKITCRADPMYFEKLDIALDDNIAPQFYDIEPSLPDTKTYIFQVAQERVKHKIQCYDSERSTLDVLKQVLGKATSVSNNTFVWQYQSDNTFNDACKKLDDYEKEHKVDLDYAAESIEIKQDLKIPGTNIVLEKGDKIVWKEADDFWRTSDMFRAYVEDTSGKIQKELDHKKNESQVLEDSGIIERKVVFDEPLFKYIVEYRSEPMYGGRTNYYHNYEIQFESRFDRQLHQFGIDVYFEDSGRSKYPSVGFSDLRKRYDMEEWLKVINTLYNILNKIANYEKTYVKIYY